VWLDSTKVDYTRSEVVTGTHNMDANALVDAVVLEEASSSPVALRAGHSRLERIRERSVRRVGIDDDNLPDALHNADDDLVRMNVEMAHRLACDLGATLELLPFERNTLARQLAEDHFDIAPSGLIGTVERPRAEYAADLESASAARSVEQSECAGAPRQQQQGARLRCDLQGEDADVRRVGLEARSDPVDEARRHQLDAAHLGRAGTRGAS
jgi:hypothetical protein